MLTLLLQASKTHHSEKTQSNATAKIRGKPTEGKPTTHKKNPSKRHCQNMEKTSSQKTKTSTIITTQGKLAAQGNPTSTDARIWQKTASVLLHGYTPAHTIPIMLGENPKLYHSATLWI
jgi:beta-lactamase superfamily II metal-dependent hydrolase